MIFMQQYIRPHHFEGGGLMIERWISEIKASTNPEGLGMILVHNGVVRGTSKKGGAVKGMKLSYDRELLEATVNRLKATDGIAQIRTWINEGELKIGDDIMYVLVAGRFRTDILPVFQELLTIIKRDIVKEQEF
jgi:molybdopterin synthase catalytic subunit